MDQKASNLEYIPRNLIITADDYGASKNINEGIKFAADQNAITTISALTNFQESLQSLKDISNEHPEIGIGVHLNIVTGKPISDAEQVKSLLFEGSRFYTIEEILPKLGSISLTQLKLELRAQVNALMKYDIKVDHLSDQNGILSLYSPFFDILTELAQEFDVPLRSPIVASVKYSSLFSNKEMKKHGKRQAFKLAITYPLKALKLLKYTRAGVMEKKQVKLNELGIPHPDLLIDCFWGEPTLPNLLSILENLPEGTSELILHLGSSSRQEEYPSGLDLEYFAKREKELFIVAGDNIKDYYRALAINLIGYSSLSSKD